MLNPAGVTWSRRTPSAPSLCVGLLQQRAPELGALGRVHEQQLPVLHRQPVVDHHLHPLAELPELKKKEKKSRQVWILGAFLDVFLNLRMRNQETDP